MKGGLIEMVDFTIAGGKAKKRPKHDVADLINSSSSH